MKWKELRDKIEEAREKERNEVEKGIHVLGMRPPWSWCRKKVLKNFNQ